MGNLDLLLNIAMGRLANTDQISVANRIVDSGY